jgi:hypothetical protein
VKAVSKLGLGGNVLRVTDPRSDGLIDDLPFDL